MLLPRNELLSFTNALFEWQNNLFNITAVNLLAVSANILLMLSHKYSMYSYYITVRTLFCRSTPTLSN